MWLRLLADNSVFGLSCCGRERPGAACFFHRNIISDVKGQGCCSSFNWCLCLFLPGESLRHKIKPVLNTQTHTTHTHTLALLPSSVDGVSLCNHSWQLAAGNEIGLRKGSGGSGGWVWFWTLGTWKKKSFRGSCLSSAVISSRYHEQQCARCTVLVQPRWDSHNPAKFELAGAHSED